MKKIVLICMCILVSATMEAKAFDWMGLFNFFSKTAASQSANTPEAQVKSIEKTLIDIQNQANAIDTSVQNEVVSIVSMLVSKNESNNIKSQLKSIMNDKIKTEEEKSELINKALIAYMSSLTSEKTTIAQKIKKMSAVQKVELIKEIASLEQYGQKYTALAKQALTASATKFFNSANSEDLAAVIANTNKTASLIKNKAATVYSIVNELRSLTTIAGVSK